MRSAAVTLWVVVAVASLAAPGQERGASQPATQPPPDPQRVRALLELLEGENSAQVRQTGAAELLRLDAPETRTRLAALLAGGPAPVRVAIAGALTDLPAFADERYLDPLMGMLVSGDAALRRAATEAVASFPETTIVRRLRGAALDRQKEPAARLAAVDCLAKLTSRAAIGALFDVLSDPAPEVRDGALAAIELLTAMRFDADIDAALRWWAANGEMPEGEWQRRQIARLATRNRELVRQLSSTRTQLVKLLRDACLRAPSAERWPIIAAYVTDIDAAVRSLGLELIRNELTERNAPPTEMMNRVRELTRDASARVRAQAVRVLAAFRDPADAPSLLELLPPERDPDVRLAIVNGIGYVGGADAVAVLAALLDDPNEALVIETVAALGRIGERRLLSEPERAGLADLLARRLERTPRERPLLRERLVWAMGRLADRRLGPVFVAVLDPSEPLGVRQAAALGIDALGDPELLAPLIPASSDADASLRKAAVDALAHHGASEAHLQALWSRLSESQEPNAQVRESAWQGAMRILAPRPPREIQAWIARLPDNGELRTRRALELLQVAERGRADGGDRAELGQVRWLLARQTAEAQRTGEALALYQRAVLDLRASKSADAEPAALEMLRFALAENLYDEAVAAALSGDPPPDMNALWHAVKGDLDERIESDLTEALVAQLARLQANPPTSMPAGYAEEIAAMLARARRALGSHSPTEAQPGRDAPRPDPPGGTDSAQRGPHDSDTPAPPNAARA